MNSFSSLNINPRLIKSLDSLKFTKMSEVQEAAIPLLLKGDSLVVKAPTGSGKTLTYLIPILNDIDVNQSVQALIIVPTKVLANQVLQVLRAFKSHGYEFSATAFVDGSKGENLNSNIIITTPTLATNLPFKTDLSRLKRTILDEGDMLLFGGFIDEIEAVLGLDLKGSTTIFTASIDEHLDTIVRKYIKASIMVDVTKNKITATSVIHHLVNVRLVERSSALTDFLKVLKPYKAIIFVSNKADIEQYEVALRSQGFNYALIHGDLPKRDQKKAYNAFNRDEVHLLLASDIAARGVDIEDVTDIISVDLPKDLTYYFHRAGRTGRFDRVGNSYVFYQPDNLDKVKELLKKSVKFDFFTLKDGVLRADRDLSTLNKFPSTNTVLEAEIKKAVRRVRTSKVKPNYKKKVKVAAERAKERHKRKIIRTNIKKKNEKNNP